MVVFVGEQPGDQKDQTGHPFVGPSGQILGQALVEAGIDRQETYVTNAVKHFKWEPQGKRRKHKRPSASEIAACRPWLDKRIARDQAEGRRVSRGDGSAVSVWKDCPPKRPARASVGYAGCPERFCDHSPLGHSLTSGDGAARKRLSASR